MFYSLLFVLFFQGDYSVTQHNKKPVDPPNEIILENTRVKAVFRKKGSTLSQHFYGRNNQQWVLVAESFSPPTSYPKQANPLLNSRLNEFRFLTNDLSENLSLVRSDKDQNRVVQIRGKIRDVEIIQTISLNGNDENLHVEVHAQFPAEANRLEYLLSAYRFINDGVPDFIHTPTLKYNEERWDTPEEDQILGDRSFHSPAIVLQDDERFFGMVPDLNAINDKRMLSPDARRTINIPTNKFSVPLVESKYTMPTALDMNVRTGLTNSPVVFFGFIDNIIQHHVRYLHPNDGKMVRTIQSKTASYSFDLFISGKKSSDQAIHEVTSFIWDRYGHPEFANKKHLALPFVEYVKTISSVTFSPMDVQPGVEGFKNTGSFLEFELNGKAVGGFRSAVPGWTDALWNSVFWNNARDAVGMFIWGKRTGDSMLLSRARRTVNLLLAAPQNEFGLFPTIYHAATNKWQTSSYDVVNKKFGLFSAGPESATYDIAAMSKTIAHLLEYYLRCEADKAILQYVEKYGDWLSDIVASDGIMPSYVGTDMKSSDVLKYSAQSAASMWLLADLYSITKKKKHLQAAERIARFLQKEIIPKQNWIDLEQYFSCGIKSLSFTGDKEQGQLARGNLSAGWATEAFAALYRVTGKEAYLKSGEACLDYLTFTQCSWNPHYIYTAYPFGGFTVDNSDHATYLDARQAEYVKPLIWYGKKLQRQDLIERGVAAARSSVVLINHPLHKMNNIYPYTNVYSFGLGPENIDHEGHPQSAMRTHASWGEGSGIFTGLSNAIDALEGGYINVNKKLAVGVDGISISSFRYENDALDILIDSKLSDLDVPFTQRYTLNLLIDGLPEKKMTSISINGKKIKDLQGKSEVILPLVVEGNHFSFNNN